MSVRSTRALVVAGGEPPGPGEVAAVGERWDVVVAADSGLDHAVALGLTVDLVVGDLDSVSAAALAAARVAGATVEAHPADKDATDLALALDAAIRRGAGELVVVGLGGGRPDHELANLLLLASPAFAAVEVEARTAAGRFVVVRSRRRRLTGRPGELVTLLPVHGPARGVRTEGLRWPLRGEDLPEATTRGVSNELVASEATVVVAEGAVLAVQPR